MRQNNNVLLKAQSGRRRRRITVTRPPAGRPCASLTERPEPVRRYGTIVRMEAPEVLLTERLILRRWRPDDEAVMAAINRDPNVVQLLNRPMDADAVGAFFHLVQHHWATHGFGPWAVNASTPKAPWSVSPASRIHHRSWPRPG